MGAWRSIRAWFSGFALAVMLATSPTFADSLSPTPGLSGPLSNFGATSAPLVSNDSSQGYGVGSIWFIAGTGETWRLRDATTGAALWVRIDNADSFGVVAGRYYSSFGVGATTATGATFPATTLRLYPFTVKSRMTLDRLGLRVVGASAGGNAQAAIYAADPVTKQAIGTPLMSSASMSTTTAGIVIATLAGSGVLEPGLYWAASMVDNTTATFSSLSGNASAAMSLIGGSTSSVAAMSNTSVNHSATYTTFGTWPDLTSVALTETVTNTAQTPFVEMRVGSVP